MVLSLRVFQYRYSESLSLENALIKSQLHAFVGGFKAQRFVKAQRVGARLVARQLNQCASA